MNRAMRTRWSLAAATGLVAAACSMPATASAERKPTQAERDAIAAIAEPIPARCIAIRVSTVDPSWAIFYSRGLRSCPGANGYVVVREVDGEWEHVYDGGGTSEGPCSAVRPVPPRAGADLGICLLPQQCGTLRIEGYDLPVSVERGRVACTTARRAVRIFFPTRGRARQSFRLAGRQWFCANSHGRELLGGGVAHCTSEWITVMVREP